MPVQISQKEFSQRFLLEFTKELIRNTNSYKSALINKEVKKVNAEKKEQQKEEQKQVAQVKQLEKKAVEKIVHEKEKRDKNVLEGMIKSPFNIPEREIFLEDRPFRSFSPRIQPTRTGQKSIMPPMFQFSGTRLPPTVEYIKPIPTPLEIDLKKLNPLIKDPFVRVIECPGQNEKTIVMGTMGRKPTGIVLTKEDIDEVIKIFVDASKIPFHEGLNKVVFGKLIFSAITSSVIGSKFTIEKMQGPPVHR